MTVQTMQVVACLAAATVMGGAASAQQLVDITQKRFLQPITIEHAQGERVEVFELGGAALSDDRVTRLQRQTVFVAPVGVYIVKTAGRACVVQVVDDTQPQARSPVKPTLRRVWYYTGKGCTACENWAAEVMPKLQAAGVEVYTVDAADHDKPQIPTFVMQNGSGKAIERVGYPTADTTSAAMLDFLKR